MTESIYDSPATNIVDETRSHNNAPFYIVSLQKYLMLSISTFGLYHFYWFYKHWSYYTKARDLDHWPIMRGIFNIFFTHSLFEHFYAIAKQKADHLTWNPLVSASFYVILIVISRVADRLSVREIGSPYSDFIAFFIFPITIAILYRAQKIANIACSDPQGSSNNRLSGLNVFWICLGSLVWLLLFLGIYAILTEFPAQE